MKGLAPISLDHGLCKIRGNLLDYFLGWSILGSPVWEISKLQGCSRGGSQSIPASKAWFEAYLQAP